jgi:ATP-independent RNA helicase DbpA
MKQSTGTVREILSHMGIKALNPMQEQVLSTEGDFVLLSPTGSGKTLAFLLPLVQGMEEGLRQTQALIVVPSRELAQQIEQVFRSMKTAFKVTACYGGHKREIEEQNLVEAPALIVGTPGRLGDHIRRGSINTEGIRTLVLDEFDKTLELGFEEEVREVLGALKQVNRRILTSATDETGVPDFVGLQNPSVLNFGVDAPPPALTLQKVVSPEADKLETLFRLICQLGNRPTIIFLNHRESVQRTSEYLREQGIVNVFYHGALEQQQRDVALSKFRNGSANVLVTTDLAARGLDIPHIRYIIHYHLPLTEDAFVHRNGRTARMEASGTAILIVSKGELVPEYLPTDIEEIELTEDSVLPEKPQWATLFVAAGKKDKVNKVDLVGFLTQKGQLRKEEIGLIDVKDFFSFVAIRKSKMNALLAQIKGQKIKGQKVKMDIAK